MWQRNRARMTAMAVTAMIVGSFAFFDRPASAEESTAQQVGSTARSGWESGKEAAKGAWEGTKEAARRAWYGTKDTAKEGWDATKDKTHEVTQDVKEGWKKGQ
jgi:hypothetical protein